MRFYGLAQLSREATGSGRAASDALYDGTLSAEGFIRCGSRWLVPESERDRVLRVLRERQRKPAKEVATA